MSIQKFNEAFGLEQNSFFIMKYDTKNKFCGQKRRNDRRIISNHSSDLQKKR